MYQITITKDCEEVSIQLTEGQYKSLLTAIEKYDKADGREFWRSDDREALYTKFSYANLVIKEGEEE